MPATKHAARTTKATIERQRAIQAAIEHEEEHKAKPKHALSKKSPAKTDKPKNPLPAQHLPDP